MSILFDNLDVIGRRFHQRLNDTEASAPIRVIGVVRDATYAATCESRVHHLRESGTSPCL